jgi:DNA-binding GntR family transcriptional regulator
MHNWAAHPVARRRAPTTMPTSHKALQTPRPAMYRTKQEMVYRAVRDAILTCELQPDQRLVIEDIARRLSVSTIPVREALQMLQSEGLVTMVPHVGAAVASLSRESVVDVFSVLEGLQVVAGRLAAADASEEALQDLSGMVTAMDEAVATGAYETWADLNTRFHATIAALPGLGLLRQSNEQALDRWDRIRRFFFNGVLVPRLLQAQREHQELMAALEAHDAPRTAAAMQRHYQGALASYLQYFDKK